MINLFRLSPNDRSMQYLFQIFGDMGGVLYGKGEDGSSTTALGALFNSFNSAILAIAALIVIYVTVVGVMKTAHEGEMMGKNWSSLWVPIRMVMGIASLVPISGGYSAIQIVMMWVIVQGIGAADVLWSTFLHYVSRVGSPTAKISVPAVGVGSTISSLYQSLVCDATFREGRSNPDTLTNTAGYYCTPQPPDGTVADSSFCNTQNPFSTVTSNSTYKMGPGGACGTLTYCNQDAACSADAGSLNCLVCKKQIEALDSIINGTLIPLAAKLEQTDYDYRNFYYNNQPAGGTGWIRDYCSAQGISGAQCCVSGAQGCQAGANPFASYPPNDNASPQNPANATVTNLYLPYSIAPVLDKGDFVLSTSKYYSGQIKSTLDDFLDKMSKAAATGGGEQLPQDLAFAEDAGWIMAGSFYYLIGHKNKNNLEASVPAFSMQGPGDLTQGAYKNYRANYSAAAALAQQAGQQAQQATGGAGGGGGRGGSSAGGSAPAEIGGPTQAISDAVNSASDAFTNNLNSVSQGVNPLVQLQVTGYTLLMIAQILFLVFLVITLVLGLLGNISVFVLGTGVTNPLGPGLTLVYLLLAPAFFGLIALLITVGGMLGVYVPLIPYVIFTVGAIGWFLSALEAMVAGPIVALGILSPSGHHEILGKAEPALMLLFNIFLRPGLMIFGLVASMLLAIAVLTMINSGFGLVVTSMVYSGEVVLATDAAGNPYIPGGVTAMIFNPLELAIFLCAYVMLVVTALNKCFSAIHVIPEKVIRWIGGHGEGAGEAEAVGAVKGGTEAGAGGAKGGVSAAEGRAKGLSDADQKGQGGMKKDLASGKSGQKDPGTNVGTPKK